MLKAFCALLLIGMVAGRATQQERIARFRELMKIECRKYGAEDKADQVVAGVMSFADCLVRVTDAEALTRLNRAKDSEISDEILKFVKLECKSQNQILQCFNTMADGLTPCVDPKQRSFVNITKQSVAEITDLFCKDDSKTFSEFVNDGGLSCMLSNYYPFAGCMGGLDTLDTYSMQSEAEMCTTLQIMSDCLINVMKTCPKPSSAEFLSELFRISYKGSSCTRRTQEDKKVSSVENNEILTEEEFKIPSVSVTPTYERIIGGKTVTNTI